jgi:hypothetical protein
MHPLKSATPGAIKLALTRTNFPDAGLRGRPARDMADKYQAWHWYAFVKRACRWSDYRLDMEFGQREGAGDIDGQHRLRAFEQLRQYGRTTDKHRRNTAEIYDLVARVGQNPRFKGACELYHSPFWSLLRAEDVTIKNTYDLVNECLALLGLKREIKGWQYASVQHYETSILGILEFEPPSLNLMALLGALYREAYLAGSGDVATFLSGYFSKMITDYHHLQQEVYSACKTEKPTCRKCVQCPIFSDQQSAYAFVCFVEQRMLHWMTESKEWAEIYGDYPAAVLTTPITKA